MTINRSLIPALLGAVFMTGFSALLYQVVWQRLLGLFSGSDVRSATLVTSAFLGGLGVGSFLGSLWADRLTNRQAIRLYGLCNLGIGLFAFLSRTLYYDVLFLRLNELAQSPIMLLVVVFLSLLIPTTLMGLSLPLLAKVVGRSTDHAARLITVIYAVNTLGAGAGTLISGWYLIGTYGYENAVYLGGGLSTLVGLLAIFILPRLIPETVARAAGSKSSLPLSQVPRTIWMWCLLVFLSGYIAISLEMIWFRILDVTLKSNAYTFAHLLAFFLIGDSIGSLVGSRYVHRIQHPRQAFLWLQGLIALYSVVIIFLIAASTDSYPLNTYIRETGSRLDLTLENNRLQWLVYLGLPAIMLLPPSFLIGFYFPIVQKAIQTDVQAVGQRVGLVEMSNIAGNTLGGILTGLGLLHVLGTADSLRLIATLGLGFIGVLLWENRTSFTPAVRLRAGGLAGALALILVLFPSNLTLWSQLHAIRDDELFLVAEDSSGVSAIREADGAGWLYANGRHQGTIPFSDTHGFLGALPALIHPNPQNILVVGIGSAGTPYAVGLNPQTERIMAVEIVGSEIEVLEDYAALEHVTALEGFLTDPRYEIIIGDGRQELIFSPIKFDIIEADAILPISSHSGLLYSREYFEAAREQLAEGGIMAQWNPSARAEATFITVFPYVTIVDAYLLGSESPIPYDAEAFLDRLNEPSVIAYLEAGGIDVEALREKIQPPLKIWTPETPRDFTPDQLNTDLFPRDEYYINNELF